MKCPKCGENLIIQDDYKEKIFKCPKCDYVCSMIYSTEIEDDQTIYCLTINKNLDSIYNINLISKSLGINFLQAKEILLNGNYLIKGYAMDIISYRDLFKNNDIEFKIDPEFKY